ncbi:unnamed protein product [Tenebrio molitor]|nr:unnamed protein product [Tenebrio molitor]
MATCNHLQPVVLLTDVMDQSICETESVFVSGTATQASNSGWFHVEQTEPLDLCLNGTILNGLTMIESYPSFKENGNLSEPSDEDVIFVKEYKTTADKMLKRLNGQKAAIKGAPRRNPVRKARITKRFEEYMDVSTFEENELLDQSAEEENSMEISENVITKNEDSEDWKVENVAKKGKQRKVISKKMPVKTGKQGRKRKINKVKVDEKKVTLNDLESLFLSNLTLITAYVSDAKLVNKLSSKGRENLYDGDRLKYAKNILKQQIKLLAVVKTNEDDLSKHISQ